jgi:hypothetical protein
LPVTSHSHMLRSFEDVPGQPRATELWSGLRYSRISTVFLHSSQARRLVNYFKVCLGLVLSFRPWHTRRFSVFSFASRTLRMAMRSPLTYRLGPKECDPCRYRHGCDPPEGSNSLVGCNRACLPGYALLVRPSRRRERTLIPVVRARLPWHRLILAWLIMWITTAFLFHLHIPDVTADWSSLHSGGAHTVFAPGLPGEFFPPYHDSRHGPSTHLSQRIVHSLELDLVLFDDDRKAKELKSLAALYCFSETVLLPSSLFACPETYHQRQLSEAVVSARAPPTA